MAVTEGLWTPQIPLSFENVRCGGPNGVIQSNKSAVIPVSAHRHVWIVAGTSCCGKSTVAQKLAEQLGCSSFIEGDDYHTAENRAKMHKGIPLTDADRAPWLDSLRDLAVKTLSQGEQANPSCKNVVLTCSALKQKYRQFFRKAVESDSSIRLHFIFLTAPANVLLIRIRGRKDHFFSSEAMIRSQLDTLEMPTEAELATDVLDVDCTADAETVEAGIFEQVEEMLLQDSPRSAACEPLHTHS